MAGLLFLAAIALPLFAQQPASIRGHIFNSGTGGPLEGALVQIEGAALASFENARREFTSKKDGQYRFNNVPAGQYSLSVSLPGFLDSPRVSIAVTAGQAVVRDLELEPTSVSSVYRVENVPLPQGMSPEISGIDFTPGGKIVLCNRVGEVWIGDLENQSWRRFARGLYEPFGVTAESDEVIYVMQRPELTRLRDSTGDGLADRFETVSEDWGLTGNYHEFAYGLRRDANGNFYGGLGMASAGGFDKTRGPLHLERVVPWNRSERLTDQHRSVARYQGWTIQITPDGALIPWASGFRQPLGLGVSPDDEVFVTDVAGSWVPSSLLAHARKGQFHGHPDGLKWDPKFAGQELTTELLAVLRTPPAVMLVHGRMGTSPGEPVWDTTRGRFGPFAGQIFIGDVTPFLMRVHLESIAGEYQGAVFPFFRERGLRQGNMRNVFGPDGHLYIGQTIRGWREAEEGLQRVVWTGENPVDILTMHLGENGFQLRFTEPMDPATLFKKENYQITRFQYHYHMLDGSLRINEAPVPVTEVKAASDGRRVDLVLAELRPGFVYELLTPSLRSRKGRPLDNPTAYYTLNRLLSGETFAGRPVEENHASAAPRPPDFTAGKAMYHLYCAPCHQPDGRGSDVIKSANFVGENSPLSKSDTDLIRSVVEGVAKENTEEAGMPAFGQALTVQEIQDVLFYIRTDFGKPSR